MSKMLSICVPTYNRSEKIKRLLTDILTFDSDEIEIIVYDNASPDNTWEVINSIEDSRLVCYRQEENVGFSANLIGAVDMASSRFVLLISDEDLISHEYMEMLLESELKEPNLGVIYGSVREGDDFYSKYETQELICLDAINVIGLQHAYMSGIVLDKTLVDLDLIRRFELEEDVILYPHELMVLSALNNDCKVKLKSETCIFKMEELHSYITEATPYEGFLSRRDLFVQLKKMMPRIFSSNEKLSLSNVMVEQKAISIMLNNSVGIWGEDPTRSKALYFKLLYKEGIFTEYSIIKYFYTLVRSRVFAFLYKTRFGENLKRIYRFFTSSK